MHWLKLLLQVLDSRLVSIFDARELELVIAGTVKIDIKPHIPHCWKSHALAQITFTGARL